MATYAMALPTAVVVDIGSTKTTVCCVEEGIIISKSVIRKNFGGDDLTQLLSRLLQLDKSLHYFPKDLVQHDYQHHFTMLELLKEEYGTLEMSTTDIVKCCDFFLKDKNQ